VTFLLIEKVQTTHAKLLRWLDSGFLPRSVPQFTMAELPRLALLARGLLYIYFVFHFSF
jgi:hypothetical protein